MKEEFIELRDLFAVLKTTEFLEITPLVTITILKFIVCEQ